MLVQIENTFMYLDKSLVDSTRESDAHHQTSTEDPIPGREDGEKHQKSELLSSTSDDVPSFQLNGKWLML